jgi:glucose uptake protein
MGFVPSVPVAFLMSVVTMVCWGLWSTTTRMTGNWRFEAWYIDYIWSVVASTFVIGVVLGGVSSGGWHPEAFITGIFHVNFEALMWALFAGIVWGIGNILLVSAIRLAGLALAFPIGIGLALALGTFLAYSTNPAATHRPVFLFIGLGCVLLAIGANGLAHAAKQTHTPSASLKRGIQVAALCGVLIALFPFPFNYAFAHGLTGYTAAFFMTVGALVSTTILLPYSMRHPVAPKEKPITFIEYKRAKPSWHIWAAVGGVVWSIGTVCNLVVASQPKFSVAIAYTLGQCAAMVAAIWGITVGKEFKDIPLKVYGFLAAMFVFYLIGIVFLAMSTG